MKRALVVLAALAFGCTPPPPGYPPPGGAGVSGGPKPSWVDTKNAPEYPDMQYMLGVGHGQGRVPCENDARADIAKIFKAEVSSVSKDWQAHFSRVNAAGVGVSIEAMSVEQLTQVSTDYVLKGTEIKAVWQGPDVMACLAVLDRVAVAQILRAEIQRLDAQIVAQVQEGDRQTGNATARYMAYKQAMELLQRREALNADLRLISRSGIDPPFSIAALAAKFTRAKSRIKIGFQLKGSERAKVQSCLAEELNKQGITVMEGSSDVDLWIHGKIEVKRAGSFSGAEMVRATINMRVTGADDGRTIAAFTRDVKAGRPVLAQSIQLAASKLCFDVAPNLASEINKAMSR